MGKVFVNRSIDRGRAIFFFWFNHVLGVWFHLGLGSIIKKNMGIRFAIALLYRGGVLLLHSHRLRVRGCVSHLLTKI